MTFGFNAFIFGFDRDNLSEITPASRFLVEIDAYLSESHSLQANITDHAVEQGSPVSDHIRLLPRIISLSGIITDTPLLGFDQGTLVTPREGRAIEKIKAIEDMREAKELFSISTTLGVIRNCFFLDFTPSFVSEDGYSAKFSATIKTIRLVTFRSGQRVLNQTQEVSSRSAETNNVGTTTPQSILVQIGAAAF